MPWTADEFRKKHNHKLNDAQAAAAAGMASAMIERGAPEGEAIATANKHVAKKSGAKHGSISDTFRRLGPK